MFGSGNQQTFNFGGISTSASTTQSTTAGAGTMANKPGGFTFGQNVTQTTGTTGISFGQATTNPAPASGFNPGNTGTVATNSAALATGFDLRGNTGTAATSSAAPGFSLGNTGSTAISTTTTPQGTAAPNTGSGGFSFGTTPTVTGVQAIKPIQPTTGTTATVGGSTGFNFDTKPSTTTTSVAAAPTTGFSFNTASTQSGLLGSATISTAAATTAGVSVGFNLPVAQPTTSADAGLATGATASTSGLQQAQITYQQLEENINKWMTDLEKQERDFLQQATQVNAWDRLLVENGEKITGLNSDMERVKIDQQKLDHELDFIKSQQKELEELLVPLEKSVEQQTNNFQHHADLERDNTYQLAENVDAQLKRMVVDLKDIIDHLNTNSSQDITDPIQQITKILNAHMDALQWVDQNTALLGRKVEDVAKQMEVQRKEQERNFRLVYN